MELAWAVFKLIVDEKSLYVQYADADDTYYIWASDTALVAQCRIIKDGGADQIDFETNYKADANLSYTNVAVAVSSKFANGTVEATDDAASIECQDGMCTVFVNMTGFTDGSVEFQGTLDNSATWFPVAGTNTYQLDGNVVFDASVDGTYIFNTTGLQKFRVISRGNTGPIVVQFGASAAVGTLSSVQAIVFVAQSGDWTVDVASSSLPTGAATETTLAAINTKTPALGQANMAGSRPVVLASNQSSIPVAATLQAGSASVGILGANSGVDIGDVTINNSTGGAAVNIQDGGNIITVDGTVSANATLSAETTKVIGTINISASQSVTATQATGSNLHTVVDSGTVTTVSTVTSLTQMNGAAISMGTGTRDAGTQRVTIATNDVVPASQNGTWTVQPGNTANTTAWKVDGSAVTQPISGTVTANAGTGTLAVSLAAGAASIGKAEDVAAGDGDVGTPSMAVRKATPANTSSNDGDYEMLQMSVGRLWTSATVDAALPAGTNRIGSVRLVDSSDADLTAVKGTQTSRAVGTQDLKDSGRVHLNYYAVAVAAGATTVETAITLTKSSGTSATTAAASFVITSGKRFRIQAISVATRGNVTATLQTTTFNLRINTAGAVTTSSTPIVLSCRSATPATISAWDRVLFLIPDGFEILGDGTLQFGITAAATYVVNAPTWDVNIIGYEY